MDKFAIEREQNWEIGKYDPSRKSIWNPKLIQILEVITKYPRIKAATYKIKF